MELLFQWLIYVFIGLTAFYAIAMFIFTDGLFKISRNKNDTIHTVSVLITVKNEESKIRDCLNSMTQQSYPHSKMEIIIADDQSTDSTPEIILEYCSKYEYIKSVRIDSSEKNIIPKKSALNRGLEISTGEIIIGTDGDCIVDSQWIESINESFSENTGMVIGHVEYHDPKNFFQGIDSLDYFSQRALGIGFVGVGSAYTCTAANFAYRRSFYDNNKEDFKALKVRPAEDNYFLYCVHERSNMKFAVPVERKSITRTSGAESLAHFFSQRCRWVAYGGNIMMKSVQIFFLPTIAYYLFINLFTMLSFFSETAFKILVISLSIKLLSDFVFMWRSAVLYQCTNLLKYFLPLSIIHLYLYPIIIVKGNVFSFSWKGKTFTADTEVS